MAPTDLWVLRRHCPYLNRIEASTAILMTIFFQQWRKAGLSAPAALRKAQCILRDAQYDPEVKNYFKDALESSDSVQAKIANVMHKKLQINDFNHPFYWAGFTFTGL